MSDYISREAIKDTMLRYGFKAPDMTVTEFVEDELPAADVEPVRHGEWLRTDDDWSSLVTIQCSACGMRPSNKPGGCRNGCIVPKLYTRLAQYEDTGLSPMGMHLLPSAPKEGGTEK